MAARDGTDKIPTYRSSSCKDHETRISRNERDIQDIFKVEITRVEGKVDKMKNLMFTTTVMALISIVTFLGTTAFSFLKEFVVK